MYMEIVLNQCLREIKDDIFFFEVRNFLHSLFFFLVAWNLEEKKNTGEIFSAAVIFLKMLKSSSALKNEFFYLRRVLHPMFSKRLMQKINAKIMKTNLNELSFFPNTKQGLSFF